MVRWATERAAVFAASFAAMFERAAGVRRAPVRALGEPFVLNHAGGFGREERAIVRVYQNVCAERR
jgi:hypothetical protein